VICTYTRTYLSPSSILDCVYSSRAFLLAFTATSGSYTLSLHDALPICARVRAVATSPATASVCPRVKSSRSRCRETADCSARRRSEEHTSELQSPYELVCRLLLEKKKNARVLVGGHSLVGSIRLEHTLG